MPVQLRWLPRFIASEHRVYRSTSPIDIASPGSALATLAGDANSYFDADASDGQTYYYVIGAVNSASPESVAFSRQIIVETGGSADGGGGGGGGGPATPPSVRGYLAMTPKTFNSTTMTANAPTETEVGDLLVMFVGCDGGVTFSGLNSGWSEGAVQANGTEVTAAVFLKIADGSDTFDATLSSSQQNTGGMFAISGADTLEAGGFATGTSASPDSGLLTLSQERSAIWFSFFAVDDNSVTDPPSTLPANYDSFEIERPALSSSASTAVAYQILSATSQDPSAWATGSTSNEWAAMTVAVYQS